MFILGVAPHQGQRRKIMSPAPAASRRANEEVSNRTPTRNLQKKEDKSTEIENLPDGLQKLKKLMHLNLERTCRLRSVVGISRLPLLSVLRLRSSKCLADLDTVNELKRIEHLEAVTIDISSAAALEELLLYNKLAKSIQRLSIVEAKNNLVLSATDDLIDLTIRSCSTLKVEIKRPSSRRSFLNLSTVCISSCDGLKELTWLLFAPNLTVLELRGLKKLQEIMIREKAAAQQLQGEPSLRKLETLNLSDLPVLKQIYWSALPFPCLESIKRNCPYNPGTATFQSVPRSQLIGGTPELGMFRSCDHTDQRNCPYNPGTATFQSVPRSQLIGGTPELGMFRSCDHTDQPPTLVGGSAVDACYSPESSYGKFPICLTFEDPLSLSFISSKSDPVRYALEMARRFSATEKAKGIAGSSAPVRRIQIPDTDTSALIEMNKLTLIGRVSNPTAQNTRALDVPNGRVRVTINGLLPLEIRLEISLPSGETTVVELEYEKLEKHCFLCSSLSHDKDSCPSALNDGRRPIPVGINQVRTTERLTYRRRVETRGERTDRQYHNSRLGPIHDDYKRLNHPRAPRERDDRVSKRDLPRHEHLRNQLSTQSSSYRSEPRSERWVPKKDSSSSRLFANAGALTSPAPSTSPQVPPSQVSHTPPPRPAREPMRLPALERLSPAESLTGSHDRRSALARISLPANKELNLPQREDGRSGSGYLHEDEQLLLEETTQDAPYGPGTSGITLPTSGSSPIRSLSEDRRHVSLRLGPISEKQNSDDLPPPLKRSGRIAAAKLTGKRKAPAQPTKSKGSTSSPRGVPMKKRRITKVQNSPRSRRKLGVKIRELVRTHWPSPVPESVISKATRIRCRIIEWTKEQNAKSSEIIKSAQEQLEEALSASVPDPDRISSITRLLEKAYLEEEEYWKQRSRIQWLQCGDRNSGYFHAITRGRKQVNKLSIMEDDQGLICDNEEGIVTIISSYFQSIFTSSGTDCIETVHEAISP
ncbi:hypothetical protein DY000_02045158 [Brassica cretica]|uniref:Zinc knuckle CX2CX4HX4C domain-containing protein n=1 Tax=Brassica cretica TaxID=69181 RepID=A0ABQ7F149_BRACR|nr:hypothetical protein DY000_02045158 [Brassica cretica]